MSNPMSTPNRVVIKYSGRLSSSSNVSLAPFFRKKRPRLRSRQDQDDAVLPSARNFADLYGGDWIVRRPDRLNSDEHPLIEFLAPVAQLERSRLGPGRLGRFYDEVLVEMPTRNFVYDPLPGARPWDPSGGRRRQRQRLADREGR